MLFSLQVLNRGRGGGGIYMSVMLWEELHSWVPDRRKQQRSQRRLAIIGGCDGVDYVYVWNGFSFQCQGILSDVRRLAHMCLSFCVCLFVFCGVCC